MATDSNIFQLVKLSELLISVKGKKPSNLGGKSALRKIPYIDINAFENKVLGFFCSDENIVRCSNADVLMVWDGSRCGYVGMGMNGALGSTLASLSIPLVEQRYLYYFLRSKFEYLNTNTRGIGIPHIDPLYLGNIDFPLTTIANQKLIADKISTLYDHIDDGIEKAKSALEKLSALWKNKISDAITGNVTNEWRRNNKLFKLLESDLVSITEELTDSFFPSLPNDWAYIKLDNVLESVNYGTSKKCAYDSTGIGVLRIPNLIDGVISDSDLKYAVFSDQEIEKFSLEKGDLLLIRSNGSLSLVGSCALVDDKDTSYLFAGYLLRLRPISEFIHPRFLMYLLASPMLRMQIENVAKSSSGVNNINAQEIRSLIIPICSLEEQMEIVNILDGIKDSIKSQQNYLNLLIDKAGLTKKNILEEAFTIGFESQPIETSDIDKYIDNIKTTKAKLIAEAKKRKPKAIRKNMTNLSILEILRQSNEKITVKQLFSSSKYNKDVSPEKVEAFYLELKDAINSGKIIIEEVRENGLKTGDLIKFKE